MHIYTPSNGIFDGLVTNLLSIIYIWIEILYCAHAKRQRKKKKTSHNDFTFDTPICLFLSDGAASMAMKGLIAVPVSGVPRALVAGFESFIPRRQCCGGEINRLDGIGYFYPNYEACGA